MIILILVIFAVTGLFSAIFAKPFSERGLDYIHGEYRVKYKDGEYSCRMYKQTAKEYAEMFGGEVVNHKEYEN